MSKLTNAPAEHRLIGSCLTDSDVIEAVIDRLGPGDFSDSRMGSIYSTVARVALKGQVTPSAVVEELRQGGVLEEIGGDKAISWLMQHACADIEEAKECATTLRELATKRDQAAAARKAAQVIESGEDPLAEIAALSELSNASGNDDGFVDLGPVIESIFTGTHRRLEPTMLRRNDGESIIYGDGRLNFIAAPPESMKSWIAKLTCVQEMVKGNAVIYLDAEETDGITCSERVVSIAGGMEIDKDQLRDWIEGPLTEAGTRDRNKRLFYYKTVSNGIDSKVRGQVARVLKHRRCSFIVLDGFAAAMASHEPPLEEDKARDVNMFLTGNIWPWTMSPSKPGILVVDHVAKSAGSAGQTSFQSRGMRGSGAKLAAASGVVLQAKAIQPGSAYNPGVVELYVVKDRPGRCKIVHRSGKRMVGVLKSTPMSDGTVEITKLEIVSPETADQEAAEKRWDLIAAEKISKLLSELSGAIPKGEVKELINEHKKKDQGSGWRGETLTKAIDFLITNGWARVEREGRYENICGLRLYKAEYGAIHASEQEANPFE
jgi:hypothetical protein